MASIPDNPRDQLLFFIDNPIVAGEPGGKAIVDGYRALIDGLLGGGDGSSASAALFGDAPFAAAPPPETAPSRDAGHSKGGGGHDTGGVTLALGLLGGIANGDLDI